MEVTLNCENCGEQAEVSRLGFGAELDNVLLIWLKCSLCGKMYCYGLQVKLLSGKFPIQEGRE